MSPDYADYALKSLGQPHAGTVPFYYCLVFNRRYDTIKMPYFALYTMQKCYSN